MHSRDTCKWVSVCGGMCVWKKVPRPVQVCIDEYLRNRPSNKCIIILILIPGVNLVFL